MVGILCEKPSAARNFAKALGGMKGVFQGEQYVIAAARGHLYEFLQDPGDMVPPDLQKKYHVWDLAGLPWDETNFSWKKVKKDGVSSVLKDIKTALSGCDEIVVATDVDPSGEGMLLAQEILSGLSLMRKPLSRMYFADEAEKSIRKAFTERKPISNMALNDEFLQADYRSKWDYLSMQFTRAASLCAGGNVVLRNGRLKSVMVSLVGDQQKKVDEYKPKPFYYPQFMDENGIVYREKNYNSEDRKVFEKSGVDLSGLHASSVTKDSSDRKSTPPRKLIDLASLSASLVKNYSAKSVLSVYQKMYEAKIVSYPRTEDKFISSAQFDDLLPLVDKIADVVSVDRKLLTHRMKRSTHVKEGGAHGANRPGPVVPDSLAALSVYDDKGSAGLAAAIYETLARSYLAMLAEDYLYDHQKGHVTDFPSFVGESKVPVSMGWKQVFDQDPDDDVSVKGLGTKAVPGVGEGVNPKPASPTMKWLMTQLEKFDVGTGATRTSTYSEVTSSSAKYPLMIDTKGKLKMSPYGEMNYVLLAGTQIGNPEVTERVFGEMKKVASGSFRAADGLRAVQSMVMSDLEQMKKNAVNLKGVDNVMAGSGNRNTKEYFSGKYGPTGQDVRFSREWGGHSFSDKECEDLLSGKQITVSGLKSKTGTPYSVIGSLQEQEYNGKKYWGFCREAYLPDAWGGHKFTRTEQADLFSGKEIHLTDMVSKKGSSYEVWLKYVDVKGTKRIVSKFSADGEYDLS